MESKVNYTAIGFFVLVLGSAAIIFFFWLSGWTHEKAYHQYVVYFKEDVTGLTVDSPVRYNGVPVGIVKNIELDPGNPQLVRLILNIAEGTPITTSTVATLQYQGITGVLYVGLKAKTMEAPPLRAQAGEKYPVIASEPSFVTQLSQVLPDITKSIKTIGDSISQLMNEENRKNIQIVLKNLATGTKDLPQLIQRLNNAADQVGRAAKTGGRTFNNISNQVVPSTQQLINQLNRSTNTMQQILNQLQQNPSILLRGRQLPPPGPGER